MEVPADAVLVIIDVQKGFDDPRWGERNNPGAEANIAKLLGEWRKTGRPVVHVRHMSRSPGSPLRPGQAGNEVKDEVKPRAGEELVEKTVNSAFIGTDLDERLKKKGASTLVIVGLTTDHCVSTTARMAGNMGYKVFVVTDATATFDRKGYDGKRYSAEEIHRTTLASLEGEFAKVVETESLLEGAQRRGASPAVTAAS